jgi:effector-binding domain-containing protein
MDPAEVSKSMGSAFQQVWAFMSENRISPTGGALSVYYTYDPDKISFRAGFTIAAADMAKASGDVKADVTPACKVLHFVHKGPYETLRAAYGDMMQYMEHEKISFAAPTWEVYLNDPSQVKPEDLLTEVFVALA